MFLHDNHEKDPYETSAILVKMHVVRNINHKHLLRLLQPHVDKLTTDVENKIFSKLPQHINTNRTGDITTHDAINRLMITMKDV